MTKMICSEHAECPIDCENKKEHEHDDQCEISCNGSYTNDAVCVEVG